VVDIAPVRGPFGRGEHRTVRPGDAEEDDPRTLGWEQAQHSGQISRAVARVEIHVCGRAVSRKVMGATKQIMRDRRRVGGRDGLVAVHVSY
jgi:hypothetical protein